ncbi:benzoylformate decarboxylase [Tsukamurella sp. 8F]|uniref:benzoylformate decarboxylase n=1 Tax=unclassified Tsukamurella TaxID=2633480 RepID=UPI0023BA0BF8|nr:MULTISPECIES: benzoylformate decarboxylase [unclassified Tsukamurella]MDF0528507.1 benzoylformate decarboxylase [Tsukamurella sp. 8J]MDF0586333.1 benzoylformate decarboxylase [Tsukamurella sp. 8F]
MSRPVREIVHGLLTDRGVTHVYGNPGSTEMRFFRDLPDGLTYVVGLQEASVVAMADGHARVAGGVGIAMVHSASGLGNALGSLYTAERNGTPLVVLAGQQSRSLLPHAPYLHARDAASFPRPYVKDAVEPAQAQDVPEMIAQAMDLAAASPAGPVFVSVPEDDWDATGREVAPRRTTRAVAPADDALAAVAADLTDARRPALVLGGRIRPDDAGAAVALAGSVGARVYVAPLADRSPFPENERHFAGFLPPVAAGVRATLAPHDVVLVAGAPVFTFHVPSEGAAVADGTTLWHITDDPREAARALAGTSLVVPPGAALAALARLCAGAIPAVVPALDRPGTPAHAVPPSPEEVLAALSAVLPAHARIVEEAPTHRNAMHDHLPIRGGQDFHVAASGGLGWGMPASVGMAIAEPGRPTLCLIGDGASLYSIQALWTAARHNATVVFVVLDNGGYAAMKAFGHLLDVPDAPGLDLPGVDLPQIARGFGAAAVTADTAGDAVAAVERGFAASGPTLIRIQVGPAVGALYRRLP